ncbi:MAG: non-homologous end-joining DNA ligase [Kiritimatiellae bacterium]|jgi:bifunctional non-homologous end joining protein LigD|nr:non-homologous end-joining DNA ligase [Kiritimatiellia bacterium]
MHEAVKKNLHYGRYTVEATSLKKELFPKAGITKQDLIRYSEEISDVMLPHLRCRPLSFERYPDGVDSEGFFQKHTPDYVPDWIRTRSLQKDDGTVEYTLADNMATLAYLANQACITIHSGLSRVNEPKNPVEMVIDLDPPDADFKAVQKVAGLLKDVLEEELGLACFAKFTGSRGIHVVVPLQGIESFETVRFFADDLSQLLVERHPDLVTTAQRKDRRGSRIFLDTKRNAYGQTVVAPYSVRCKKNAPVACPVEWEEALAKDVNPRKYTLKNMHKRLNRKGDVWLSIRRHAATLAPRRDKL